MPSAMAKLRVRMWSVTTRKAMSRAVCSWVAQATGLCRWATSPAEWDGASFCNPRPDCEAVVFPIPVGDPPTGTDESPVLPFRTDNDTYGFHASMSGVQSHGHGSFSCTKPAVHRLRQT